MRKASGLSCLRLLCLKAGAMGSLLLILPEASRSSHTGSSSSSDLITWPHADLTMVFWEPARREMIWRYKIISLAPRERIQEVASKKCKRSGLELNNQEKNIPTTLCASLKLACKARVHLLLT